LFTNIVTDVAMQPSVEFTKHYNLVQIG